MEQLQGRAGAAVAAILANASTITEWMSPLSDRLKTKDLLRNPKKAKAINDEVLEFVAFDDLFLSLNMRLHTFRCSIVMIRCAPAFDRLNSYGNILNILL